MWVKCHHTFQTWLAVALHCSLILAKTKVVAEVDKLDKADEVAKVDEVEEKTKPVYMAEKCSTIQEDQNSEDPFKHWKDMCSNHLRNQMIKLNSARQ